MAEIIAKLSVEAVKAAGKGAAKIIYGTAPSYKVSWVSSESKRVDSQRLRKEQPDIFNQYSKNVSSRLCPASALAAISPLSGLN